MKKIIPLVVVILFSVELSAQVNFMGYLVNETDKKMHNVSINLYEGNTLVSTEKWSKSFLYDLELEKYYTLELVKDSYITKRIAISTFEGDKGEVPFMFVMELNESAEGIDENELDFPSTIIEYKPGIGDYSFNVEYTNNIKKEHKEILAKRK